MQKAYYRLLGWDEKGVPTKERLGKLQIKWAAEHI